MRVIVVDDSLLVREGLSALLRSRGHEVVEGLGSADLVPALVRTHSPDIVIVDIKMPPTFTDEGLQLAALLRRTQPEVAVLVLSQYVVGGYVAWLLERTPVRVGYLLKDNILRPDVLEQAMARIAAGGTFVDASVAEELVRGSGSSLGLSERETEVLRLMAEGLSDRGIADRLTVSIHTVATHVQHVFAKLALPGGPADNRRVQAVVAYLTTRRRTLPRAGESPPPATG
ncbi:MAG: response regulator transcription factor [Micropruina sp.]